MEKAQALSHLYITREQLLAVNARHMRVNASNELVFDDFWEHCLDGEKNKKGDQKADGSVWKISMLEMSPFYANRAIRYVLNVTSAQDNSAWQTLLAGVRAACQAEKTRQFARQELYEWRLPAMWEFRRAKAPRTFAAVEDRLLLSKPDSVLCCRSMSRIPLSLPAPSPSVCVSPSLSALRLCFFPPHSGPPSGHLGFPGAAGPGSSERRGYGRGPRMPGASPLGGAWRAESGAALATNIVGHRQAPGRLVLVRRGRVGGVPT